MMKKTGWILLTFWLVLAFAFSAMAMGFEAETVYESIFVISDNDSMGSGFAVGKTILITNAHVVEQNRTVNVTTYAGKTYKGTVRAADERLDLAIVTVEGVSFAPLTLGDETKAKIGDDIYTVGAPNSMIYTLTKGVISAKDRLVSGQTYLQIDAAVNSGNSGGPLLDDAGRVLGINTLKLSNSEGIGLSIPISRAVSFLRSCGIDIDTDPQNGMAFGGTERGAEEGSSETANEPSVVDPQMHDGSASGSNRKTVILFSSITGGAALLATLIAVLFYRRNKSQYVTVTDPSDRTDFEIDILE